MDKRIDYKITQGKELNLDENVKKITRVLEDKLNALTVPSKGFGGKVYHVNQTTIVAYPEGLDEYHFQLVGKKKNVNKIVKLMNNQLNRSDCYYLSNKSL